MNSSSKDIVVETTLKKLRNEHLIALCLGLPIFQAPSLRFAVDIIFMKIEKNDVLMAIDKTDVRKRTPEDVYSILSKKNLDEQLTLRFMKGKNFDPNLLEQKKVRESLNFQHFHMPSLNYHLLTCKIAGFDCTYSSFAFSWLPLTSLRDIAICANHRPGLHTSISPDLMDINAKMKQLEAM